MMQQGEKPTETRPDDHTATGPTRQQRLTHGLAESYGHRAHSQKIRHVPEPWQQVDPGAMKGGTYGHQVRLGGERAAKNTAKTFIVGHLGNAVMVHQDRQIWPWPPAHLKSSRDLPYQCARSHGIVSCGRERRESELHRGQVHWQWRRVDTVPKHWGHDAT